MTPKRFAEIAQALANYNVENDEGPEATREWAIDMCMHELNCSREEALRVIRLFEEMFPDLEWSQGH